MSASLTAALAVVEDLGLDPRATNLERVRDGYGFTCERDGRTVRIEVTEPGSDAQRMREHGEGRRAHNDRLHAGGA